MNVSLLRRLWVTFSAWVIGIYASVINRFEIEGDHHLPREKRGVLILSNHISAYETIFIPWAVLRRNPFRMLWAPAKEELFRSPLQRWLYTSWGAFPVKRGRDVKAGKTINDLLADQQVMLYPEGTRHRDGLLGKGNRGVGKIIYDTHPLVIPTALLGLNHWKFPGIGQKGKVIFGQPMDFSDCYGLADCKETHQMIVDRVMDEIARLLQREGAFVGRSS
ncbi:MAG: lysophospholipid acyltransferase family protein [Desulfuromonadia bacterium]